MTTEPQGVAQYGTQHPLAASDGGRSAWQIAPELYAWTVDGDVILQGPDGDVTIPAHLLPLVSRGLLAAHVCNGRPGSRGKS